MAIDLLGAQQRAAQIAAPSGPPTPQLSVTREQAVLHQPQPIEIDGAKYDRVYQVSPSLGEFADQLKCFWAAAYTERGDGVLAFPEDPLPWVYDIGKVELDMNGKAVSIEIPMRANAPINRLYPAPGTVIHTVPLQSWMTVNSGNLGALEKYLREHPNPLFFDQDVSVRLEAIMEAQMAFDQEPSSTENGASTAEGEPSEESSEASTVSD